MADDQEILVLREQIEALKAEMAELTAWRNREPVVPRSPDDTDEEFQLIEHKAKIYFGREASEIARLRRFLVKVVADIDWCAGFLEKLNLGHQEFADQFAAMRARCFPGIEADCQTITRIVGERKGPDDNPLDESRKE